MKPRNDSLIKGRIKSLLFCINGIKYLIQTEKNFQIQIICATIICSLGLLLNISKIEWIAQLIVIGMVLTAESLNTAFEMLADVVQPKYDKRIGLAKDMSAGAVGISAIISLIVASLIYIPKILSFF